MFQTGDSQAKLHILNVLCLCSIALTYPMSTNDLLELITSLQVWETSHNPPYFQLFFKNKWTVYVSLGAHERSWVEAAVLCLPQSPLFPEASLEDS